MMLSENISVMLLSEPFFKSFHTKEITDTRTHTEGWIAIDLSTRAAVDEMANNAVAGGGLELREPRDEGWMITLVPFRILMGTFGESDIWMKQLCLST